MNAIKIELSVPDATLLLSLLETSPDQWPDVIEELRNKVNEVYLKWSLKDSR